MSLHQDTIAVIIAAYNAENTIAQAVSSALKQTIVSQVIVVDDASNDATSSNAQLADDGTDRLIVVTQAINQGPAAARNVALEHVTANWFTVLDADDYMLEARLEKLLTLNNNEYDILADDLWLVREGESIDTKTSMLGIDTQSGISPLTLESFISGNIPQKDKTRRELGFLKPIIRMQALRDIKTFYDERMRLGEDYDLYVRLLANGAKAGLTPALGYVAIRRTDSLSGKHGHTDLQFLYESTRAHQKLPNLSSEAKHLMRQARSSVSLRYRWAKMIHDKKAKNLLGFLSCFLTSPKNIALLLSNLVTSILDRTMKPDSSKSPTVYTAQTNKVAK